MEMNIAIQALELLKKMAERDNARSSALEEVGLYTEGVYSDFDDYANFVGNALEDNSNVICAWLNAIWAKEENPILQYDDIEYPMETAEDVYNLIVKFRNVDVDFCY